MIARLAKLVCLALPLAAFAGCSSADDSSSKPGTSMPAAFTKYCTGTLKVEKKMMAAMGSGGWSTDGSKAPAGTSFLVSPDFGGQWDGYLFAADGTPRKLDSDFKTGLVKDTEFTSDCAVAPSSGSSKRHTVLLANAKIYNNKELTGTACTLEMGTELKGYSFSGGFSGPATITSPTMTEKCTWETGYSTDLQFGEVLDK